ncbi:unnamed protein product [Cyclocybe aegerita]|uniref:Homeobox domain-containing protein n=1 Tax=Cyclocybe aegerita TaxID=1973307 RepID=A0A8S0XLI8_CYCAE|nr:unnamed protein product [Cyclocybe aegerita]
MCSLETCPPRPQHPGHVLHFTSLQCPPCPPPPLPPTPTRVSRLSRVAQRVRRPNLSPRANATPSGIGPVTLPAGFPLLVPRSDRGRTRPPAPALFHFLHCSLFLLPTLTSLFLAHCPLVTRSNLAAAVTVSRPVWDFQTGSKDMAQHSGFARHQRASLQLDPVYAQTDGGSTYASPASSSAMLSPASAVLPSSQEGDEDKEPSSGPQRSSSTSGKADKEKRKRSRVTPEQLIHLERFFAMDRSPTAAKRKDISNLLGMQERQTQIWFQNRRAKAKLQDGKFSKSDPSEISPESPPELPNVLEIDLNDLIHEDEPVTFVPCTDLTVGTWRRIATSATTKHDLVAYVCERKRCLTWFLLSGGCGYKMELPFHTIINTEFQNASANHGMASFTLSQPPLFYLETVSSPQPDGSVMRGWKRCADWTENTQATQVLLHTVIGSVVQLAYVLRALHKNNTMPDRRASYHGETHMPPMELPPPPMAALTAGATYGYSNTAGLNSVQFEPSRKRLSYESGMQVDPQYADGDLRSPQHIAPISNLPTHPYMPATNNQSVPNTPTPNFDPAVYHNYQSSLQAASRIPTPPEQPAQQQPAYPSHNPRALHPYQHPLDGQMAQDPAVPMGMNYSPSRSLLMSPYYPDTTRRFSEVPQPHSPQVLAGMPGIIYNAEADYRRRRSE